MTNSNSIRAIAAAGIVAVCAACSDGPTGPQTGSLRISVGTTGGDQDENGYRIVLGSVRQQSVPIQWKVVFDGISAGTHILALEGVADNCSVADTHPRPVAVSAGDTTDVRLSVTCEATGIEITTQTTGPDQPSEGYTVTSGDRWAFVPANGSALLSRLQAGIHTVSLNAGANCRGTGGTVASATVPSRGLVRVSFEIACIRTEKRIVFVKDNPVPGNPIGSSIVVADANGASILPLGPGYDPAWSPDGTRIVFSNTACDFYYYDDCSSGGLSVVDPETRSLSVIAGGRGGIQPAWSPDGKVVAFSIISRLGGATLHVAGLDGSPAKYLVTPVRAEQPSWSPDGRQIAFMCASGMLPGPSRSDICVINSDGTGFTRLTDDAANDGQPAWSPDGSRIAFTTYRFSSAGDIALMTVSGTGITRLTNGLDPAWSNDGRTLVFVRTGGLFTAGADGSNVTRLTTGNHHSPAWRQ